jgi:peptidoglycan hydrolase CwlO-like protein
MEQMLLFELSHEEKLMRKVEQLEEKLDRQRKSQFAKIGALAKKYDETTHELAILKAAMCRTA